MSSSNIICFLDENNVVKHIEYCNFGSTDKTFAWNKYIGQEINRFLDIDLNKNSGHFNLKGDSFRFTKVKNAMGRGLILYITQGNDNSKIYEEVFDCIPDAVQIFDKNGYLLFCNKASEKIEKTNRLNVIGKHLMDIYDLNEDYSTVLNTIKSKEPVLNRCDHFKAKDGEFITTMNTGMPLFIDNTLIGAVGLAQDSSVIEQHKVGIDVFEKYLSEKNIQNISNKKNYYKFKYYKFDDLIGEDINFKEAIDLARNIAVRDCSVLIYGETGTGKELFAQSIHSASHRKDKEFVAINCAAIPENLIEGILFGTERGSFTGSTDKMGLFEQADGGTLFLDEINSMDIHMQSKLLRVLQEKRFKRVGGLKDIYCDVRIISSTNEEPIFAINNNKIRKDVYYRISTVTISIPPLRERIVDVDVLAKYFIDKLSGNYSKQVKGISAEALTIFKGYEWPGNVRELVHVLEYCFNTMTGDIIQAKHLPKYLRGDTHISSNETIRKKGLKDIMDHYEKEVIENTMKRHNNNVTNAADELGIMRQSLQYRIKKYNL
ncbi:MAG TPA: sigma 54-interacting transcriptional regulator [Anaerovoracaceae bacterium]|nr:sigma 54-interacting transcriptional regulator [Anaerovoracaceae bacterium]